MTLISRGEGAETNKFIQKCITSNAKENMIKKLTTKPFYMHKVKIYLDLNYLNEDTFGFSKTYPRIRDI